MIDSVESTDTRSKLQIIEEVSQRAIEAAVKNGALRQTISIVEMDEFPLQYIANKARMIVKAVGDFDYGSLVDSSHLAGGTPLSEEDKARIAAIPVNAKERTVSFDSFFGIVSVLS